MTTKKIKTSDILGDNYYIYELTSSNYTPNLNDTITITCICKDIYGDNVANKSLTLYHNSISKGTQTTNSSGIATWSVTCSTAGLQKFNIKDRNIEVFVDSLDNILEDFTIKTFTDTLKGRDDGGTYIYNTAAGDWEINLDLTNFDGNELEFQGSDYSFTISEGNYYARSCLVIEAGGYGTMYLTDSYVLYDDISSMTIAYTSSTKQININIYQDNTLIDDVSFDDRLNQYGTITIYSDGILEGTVTSNLQVPIHHDSLDYENRIDGDCILIYDVTFEDENTDESNYNYVDFTFEQYNGVYRYNNKIYLINEYKNYNNFNGFGDFITSYPVLTTDRQFTVKRYYLAERVIITEWNDTMSVIEQTDWSAGYYDNIQYMDNVSEYSLVQLVPKYIFSTVADNLTTDDSIKVLSAKQGKELKTLVDSKQETLISGTNIKTINNNDLLGSGNITIGNIIALVDDDCSSSTGLANYNSSSIQMTNGQTSTCQLEYDSTNQCYKLTGSGSYISGLPVIALNSKDDVTLRVKFKLSNANNYCQLILAVTPDLSNNTAFYGVRQMNGTFQYLYDYGNGGGHESDNISISNITSTWHYLELKKSGTDLTCKIYDDSMNRLASFSKTIPSWNDCYYLIGRNTENTSYYTLISEIYSEQIKSVDIDDIYPMGSVYFTVNSSTDPSIEFGGNWRMLATGLSGIYAWKRVPDQPTPTVVYYDAMNDSSTLSNYTMQNGNGSMRLEWSGDDHFYIHMSGLGVWTVNNLTVPNSVKISCDWFVAGSNTVAPKILLYDSNLQNGYGAKWDYYPNTIDIYHHTLTSEGTNIETDTFNSVAATWYSCEFIVDGTVLTYKIYDNNGNLLKTLIATGDLNLSSSSNTVGFALNTGDAYIRKFKVETFEEE